jgi:hypothetical protein
MRATTWAHDTVAGRGIAASSANFTMAIGDSCEDPTHLGPCFWPQTLTIAAGDRVNFIYWPIRPRPGCITWLPTMVHFDALAAATARAATAHPVDYNQGFGFSRTFSQPGRVTFRDEVSKAAGEIIVKALDIGKGFTGAWFDPAQSGHGLFVEVLPGNQLLAAWFTFGPSGEQAWFIGTGPYSGQHRDPGLGGAADGRKVDPVFSMRAESCTTGGARSRSLSPTVITAAWTSSHRGFRPRQHEPQAPDNARGRDVPMILGAVSSARSGPRS